VQYGAGSNTSTATGHVTITDSVAGVSGTASQVGPDFTAN
jgi:hypothetical protein